jgi:hypothetical protein
MLVIAEKYINAMLLQPILLIIIQLIVWYRTTN